AVVAVLRDVRREVGIQRAVALEAPVQRRLHEVADQEVVEDAVLDRRHERPARDVEGEPLAEGPAPELDALLAPADAEADEVERLAEIREAREVRAQPLRLVALERLGPVVAELARVE